MMKPGRHLRPLQGAVRQVLEGGRQGAVPDSVFHRRASGHDRRGHAELALWLKKNGFRADQVQAFLPSPMATATAMYHTGKNPLRACARGQRTVDSEGLRVRRLHKAFLRYHDPNNWPLLREALRRMGRADLIGHLRGNALIACCALPRICCSRACCCSPGAFTCCWPARRSRSARSRR
jgi:hypothetical protein